MLLVSCAHPPAQVLGTVEWDRISLPAPVSERIASVSTHDGETVAQGQTVMVLETARTQARMDAARAEVVRLQRALEELRTGPRPEDIEQARAKLRGAESVATNSHQALARTQALVARKVLPRADLDSAVAQAGSADAEVNAAQQALATLLHGSRSEDIAQAQAAVASAQAQADAVAVDLQRTRIDAPRAGRIDSLPYKPGDQPPVGAPLAIELIGDAPYARVYVPEPLRARVHVGDAANVVVDGRKGALTGHVRAIHAEPGFTPYYALNGEDAARLSYLAEIALGPDAKDLPVGVPVHVDFANGATK
jgi:HlyD family secretion protein